MAGEMNDLSCAASLLSGKHIDAWKKTAFGNGKLRCAHNPLEMLRRNLHKTRIVAEGFHQRLNHLRAVAVIVARRSNRVDAHELLEKADHLVSALLDSPNHLVPIVKRQHLS
jgi:hypothetical protein